MSTLFGRAPKDSFAELLKLNNAGGLSTSLANVEDGAGVATPLQLSKTQIALNGAIWPTSVGTSGQVLTAGANGTMTWANAASSGLNYVGTWNAATNTPTLASGAGSTGAMYKVSASSSSFVQNLQNSQSGNNNQYFMSSVSGVKVGQAFFWNATFLGFVQSLNGSIITADRYTNAVISGGLTFYTGYLDGTTSFNVGDYVFFDGTAWQRVATSSVTSVFGRTGAVTLTSSDVTTALGFTPGKTMAFSTTTPLNAGSTLTVANMGTLIQCYGSSAFTVTLPTIAATTVGTMIAFQSTNTLTVTVTAPDASSIYMNSSPSTSVNLLNGDTLVLVRHGSSWVPMAGSIANIYSTSLATNYASLSSPAFTGTPTAPTATTATSNTQIATTAFVKNAIAAGSGSSPNSSITATTIAANYNLASTNNVFYSITSSAYYGIFTPAANTLTQGWTTTIMTLGYAGGLNVNSNGSDFFYQNGSASSNFSTMPGYAYTLTAVPSLNRFIVSVATTLQSADVTKALGYTPVNPASAALTGTPVAPTATAGTNTTQLATTAFVTSAVSGVTGGKYTTNAPVTSATTAAMGSMYTCTSAGYNMTLPALSGTTNGTYTTILNGASTGNITVVTTGSDKLWGYFGPAGGASSMTLYPGESATFVALPAQSAWDVVNFTRIGNTAFTGRTQSDAYSYSVKGLGSVSGAQTLDLSVASEFTMTITGNTTFAFTNTLASNTGQVVYLRLTNPAAGTISWPTSTKFAAGTPPAFTSGVDMLAVKYDFTTLTYMVFVIGQAIA